MTWLKVDDKFPRHRRIRELRRDTAAKWLHVTALCFCSEHLTDGRIDDVDLPAIIHDSELPATTAKRCLDKLVEVGLWEKNEDDSYTIRDFLDYNPPAEKVKDDRAAARERMKLVRDPVLRDNIRLRDGDKCRYCGTSVRWSDRRGSAGGTYDHVDPNGGSDISNLVIACRGCNSRKGPRTPERAGMTLIDIDAYLDSNLDTHLEVRFPRPDQSLAQSLDLKTKSSSLLDSERSEACNSLLGLVKGGDNGTPRVVERFCKQLPRDRIDRVASSLRLGVKPAIAVAALKREVKAYEAEVRAEGAA